MKEHHKHNLIVIQICILSFLLLLNGYLYYEYIQNQKEQINLLERFEIREVDFDNVTFYNGVYNPNNDFYCVWLKGRSLEDIQRTDGHEIQHAMISRDWQHFCAEE